MSTGEAKPLSLVDFLRNLAKFLETGAPYFREEIENGLRAVLDNIYNVAAGYQGEPPAGTETIQELMLESLQLLESGINDFFAFLEDGNVEHLHTGLAKAEEADDVLMSIEYLIEESKQWMSEYSAG